MSFLNPVNEPVLRFKSTDAGAPQINYNSRTAGDVKAVLKACLVTGYGAVAGAGWSIVNEVDHVCEFVSPSVAMSDYRLGIDDSLADKTAFYYMYQDARTNPTGSHFQNTLARNLSNIDKTSNFNTWQLLTTDRGFLLIESLLYTKTQKVYARVTYFGQLKGVSNQGGQNISFMVVGGTSYQEPHVAFSNDSKPYRHFLLGGVSSINLTSAVSLAFSETGGINYPSGICIRSNIYLFSGKQLLGAHPALLMTMPSEFSAITGLEDTTVSGRNLLDIPIALLTDYVSHINNSVRVISVFTDYWEF